MKRITVRSCKTTGDGVHAAFADASDAIDAAVAAQRALVTEPWDDTGELRVRMGVHTGSAERRGGDYYGPAVNQAARLMGIADGGQIVCSAVVAGLIDVEIELIDLGAHQLRDVESTVRVFQILAPGLESQFPPLTSLDARRSNLPHEMGSFVGRIDDVTAVVKAFAEARVVSVVGMGGVGKTRLALRVGLEVVGRLSRTACGGANWLACVIPTPSPTRSPPRSGTRPQWASHWLTVSPRSSVTSTCCWCWTTASTSWDR